MRITRLTEEDWPTLRQVRLRALADAPAAFWASYADEAAYGERQWRSFARAAAWFVAVDGETVSGLAAGLARAEAPGVPEVISMWVAPEQRRRGVAAALLDAVTDWAASTGARTVALWVTEGNTPAQRLYEGHGFSLSGETAPVPRNPVLLEHRMCAPVVGPDAPLPSRSIHS